MRGCYDCGKETEDFRCDECFTKAERGELKYPDTGKFRRINHFGGKEYREKQIIAKACAKPSVIKQRKNGK